MGRPVPIVTEGGPSSTSSVDRLGGRAFACCRLGGAGRREDVGPCAIVAVDREVAPLEQDHSGGCLVLADLNMLDELSMRSQTLQSLGMPVVRAVTASMLTRMIAERDGRIVHRDGDRCWPCTCQ